MNSKGSPFTVITSAIPGAVLLSGGCSVVWLSSPYQAYMQTSNNSSQAATVDQLAANLAQARDAIASGNTTASTTQLTSIIGERSDILGDVTRDDTADITDEHTHFFAHKSCAYCDSQASASSKSSS